MGTLNWSCKVILTFITAATSTELVPERFLRPRDFNHHPFTDVGVPASLKPAAEFSESHPHPYAILSKKRPREGRQFPHQDVFLYPTPHPSVLPRKHHQLETNEISNYDDPYVHIPKNYAFSYSVKDHQSGDDFSHSQAHNGKATRGQYRVKLPDGRVQVVSYTADHKGYRADVQYEDDLTVKRIPAKALFKPQTQHVPETPVALPQHVPNTLAQYRGPATAAPVQFPRVTEEPAPAPAAPEPLQYRFVPRYNIDPSNYLGDPNAVTQQPYVSPTPEGIRYIISEPQPTTPAPQYEDAAYVKERYIGSTTAAPYHQQQHYVARTPQYGDRQFVSTTPAPEYVNAGHYPQSHNYDELSSPSTAQVLVTPRTLFNSAVQNGEVKQRPHILYRLVHQAPGH